MFKTLREMFNSLTGLVSVTQRLSQTFSVTPTVIETSQPQQPIPPTSQFIDDIINDCAELTYNRGFWSKLPTLAFSDWMKADGIQPGKFELLEARGGESFGFYTIAELQNIMTLATPPYEGAPNSNEALFTQSIARFEKIDQAIRAIRQQKTPAPTAEVFQFPSLSA